MTAGTATTHGTAATAATASTARRRTEMSRRLHADSPSVPDELREELPQYKTPVEIAYMLNISKRTVLELLRNRKLKGRKIAGQWRVHPNDLKAFIENGEGEQ